MAELVFPAVLRALDANGDPVAAAPAYFYETDTTTPLTVYADNDGNTAHPSPLVADANGTFPPIFHTGGGGVKVDIQDPDTGASLPRYPINLVLASATTTGAASQITFAPTTEVPETNVQDAIQTVATLGKRIHQVFFDVDATDYSTTSTSAFAAGASAFSVTPSETGTDLIGVVVVYANADGADDAGIEVRLEYYDGSSYQANSSQLGTNQRVGINTTGPTGVTPYGTLTFPFRLPEASQRSDDGRWTIRPHFNAVHSGNTATVLAATILAVEIDA